MNKKNKIPVKYLQISIPFKILLSLLIPVIILYFIMLNPSNDWDMAYGQAWLSLSIIIALLLYSVYLLAGSFFLTRLSEKYLFYLILSVLIAIVNLFFIITGLPDMFLYPIDYHFIKIRSLLEDNSSYFIFISFFIVLSVVLIIELIHITKNHPYRKKILSVPLYFFVIYLLLFVSSNFWNSEQQVSKFLESKDYQFVINRLSPEIVRKYPNSAIFALHSAVENNDRLSIVKLLDNGTDINGYYSKYFAVSPLILAIWEENIELVEYLLSRSANPNLGRLEFDAENKVIINHTTPWEAVQKKDNPFRDKAIKLLQQYGANESNNTE